MRWVSLQIFPALCLIVCSSALAQSPSVRAQGEDSGAVDEQRTAPRPLPRAEFFVAPRHRPRRERGRALRYENLSDNEAREIEAIATRINPGAIVNIASVKTGCRCEDGPECTDQVWVVADNSVRSVGLELSRIGGVWEIGPLQKWWLQYDAIRERQRASKDLPGKDRFKLFAETRRAMKELSQRYPKCSLEAN